MDYKAQFIRFWPATQFWLVALGVVLLAVMASRLTWQIVAPDQTVITSRVEPVANGQAGNSQISWAAQGREIAAREFFGEVIIEAAAPEPVAVEAPETSLNLTLQAIMATGSGQGFAIISQRSGAGEVFNVGDDLFGQATLESVFADRVIINRRGQLETLSYEELESSGLLQAANNETQSSNNESSFREVVAQTNRAVADGEDFNTQVQVMMDYVSQRANEDPEAFLEEVGLRPTEEGYQVTRTARQLQMVGLRPGDVVTAVNDMPVGNVQSDQALLNQMVQSGGQVKIQIRRGSRSFTIYQDLPGS